MKQARLFFALLFCLGLSLSGSSAFASHLRGTSVSWSPTANPREVKFTIAYSQRTSYGCPGACVLNGTVSIPFNFGDGNSTNVSATITSLNAAEDYLSAVATLTHTYAGAGPYTAFYESTARVSSIISGHDQTMRMETTVSPLASPLNHSPVSSMPAIVTVPLQASTGFMVAAADQDGDALSFRLSTAGEMYDIPSFSCAAEQPPGLSISNSGQVTWDTTQIAAAGCGFAAPAEGDLWTVQFMVQDTTSSGAVKSKIPVDIILKFVSNAQPPPTVTFSNPGPITATPGSPVSFTISADQAGTNARVTFNVTGLPIGATATNTNQALIPPVGSTFSWTPTQAQAGTYVVTYTVTNDTLQQTLSSITINVPSAPPPVVSCPALLAAQYNTALAIPVQVSDPQGLALTAVWQADGSTVQTDNVPASGTATSLSLNQTFSSLGAHSVVLTATNSQNVSASCTVPVTVSAADQTVSFGTVPGLSYGDPDLALAPSATSGLPVTLAASGSCSIVGGAVHATGAGSCLLTATQPGNGSTYNAAPPVQLTVPVGQRHVAVTVNNATRQYGQANPVFTATINGVVNSDNVTVSYATTATANSLAGSYAIVPTVGGTSLANYLPTLSNGVLTITAGAPSKLVAGVLPGTLVAGGNVGTVSVRVEDVGGNTAITSAAPVTATITGPNGYSETVTIAAVNGIATLNLSSLHLDTAGTYTVATSSAGLTGTSSTVTVTPGPADHLRLGALPSSIVSGGSLSQLSITAQDSHGNTATGTGGTITATLSGPGGFSQTVTGSVVNGVVTLDLSSLKPSAAGVYTLIIAEPGQLTGTTTITITPAPQVVSLPTLPPITYGAGGTPFPPTTSAGLPITYTVTGPAVMNGSTLVITGAGTVTVTATQAGDAAHSPVVETSTIQVAQAASTVALVTSSGVATAGAPILLTATVSSTAGSPSGTVTFFNGTTVLGTVPVGSSGVATLTVSDLPTGGVALTAGYGGDTNYAPSSSPVSPAAVQDFGIAATAGTPSVPVVPGETGEFTLALTPGAGGFTSAITLTATGLPEGATLSFSPATATPGTAVAMTTLSIKTAKPVHEARLAGRAAGIAIAVLLLPFGMSRRARSSLKGVHLLRALGAVLLMAGLASLAGCGTSNGFFGQPGRSYTINVTATSGALAHTTQVVLNVQ